MFSSISRVILYASSYKQQCRESKLSDFAMKQGVVHIYYVYKPMAYNNLVIKLDN
jgi:hypothetical protein